VAGVAQHVGDTAAQTALVKAVIARFGKLDILVSNVATNPSFGPMLDTDELVWDKIFATNVKAMFTLARVCVPHLRESTMQGGGCVLIVTSIGGYAPMPMLGAYSVSKTALIGLTKALAGELGPLGVRVNALAPGIVRTNFSAALWKGGDSNAIAQTAVRAVPLGRFAEADEMGGPAAFLVSPDASYVTGEVLVASGGMQSRL
jgi:dehydrogenase/reductase SDR family protein 4